MTNDSPEEVVEDGSMTRNDKIDELYKRICEGNPTVASRVEDMEVVVRGHTKEIAGIASELEWVRNSLNDISNKISSNESKLWALLIGILGLLGALIIEFLIGGI